MAVHGSTNEGNEGQDLVDVEEGFVSEMANS